MPTDAAHRVASGLTLPRYIDATAYPTYPAGTALSYAVTAQHAWGESVAATAAPIACVYAAAPATGSGGPGWASSQPRAAWTPRQKSTGKVG